MVFRLKHRTMFKQFSQMVFANLDPVALPHRLQVLFFLFLLRFLFLLVSECAAPSTALGTERVSGECRPQNVDGTRDPA